MAIYSPGSYGPVQYQDSSLANLASTIKTPGTTSAYTGPVNYALMPGNPGIDPRFNDPTFDPRTAFTTRSDQQWNWNDMGGDQGGFWQLRDPTAPNYEGVGGGGFLSGLPGGKVLAGATLGLPALFTGGASGANLAANAVQGNPLTQNAGGAGALDLAGLGIGAGVAGIGAGAAGEAAGGAGTAGGYTGADAAAYGAGINPETGEAMNLGAQELGIGMEPGPGAGAAVGGGAEGAAMLSGPAAAGAGAGGIGTLGAGLTAGSGLLGILGRLAPGLLGIGGSISQRNQLNDLADNLMRQGQPYRDLLQGSYTNPGSYLQSPEVTGAVQQGTNALARSLSMQGNPAGSGTALQTLQDYATNQQLDRLAQYRQQLGGFGGLANLNAAAPGAQTAAAGSLGNVWNAGGAALSGALNPQPNLVDILRMLGGNASAQ